MRHPEQQARAITGCLVACDCAAMLRVDQDLHSILHHLLAWPAIQTSDESDASNGASQCWSVRTFGARMAFDCQLYCILRGLILMKPIDLKSAVEQVPRGNRSVQQLIFNRDCRDRIERRVTIEAICYSIRTQAIRMII